MNRRPGNWQSSVTSTIEAVHLMDSILPQVAKLSKTLQTDKLEILQCLPVLTLLPTHWMMLSCLQQLGCLAYLTHIGNCRKSLVGITGSPLVGTTGSR